MTGTQTLLNEYGIPNADYEKKWCAIWDIKNDFPWFPASTIYLNHDFRSVLYIAFTELQNNNLHKEIKTFDGCFERRDIRGAPGHMSAHSWGVAIDMDAKTNPLVINPTPEQRKAACSWSPEFVSIMKAAGLFWGGDFEKRSDGMHFCLVDL